MCRIIEMTVDDKRFHVADIKQKYVENIIDAARKCDFIDYIMLFGSSIEDRCREDSDIDLAVFGNKTNSQAYRSKKYDAFLRQIYGFDFDQNYDLLYFKTGGKYNGRIFDDIAKGEMIYGKNYPE